MRDGSQRGKPSVREKPFGKPPHPQRAEILDRLRAGEDPKALADEYKIAPSTMRGYAYKARLRQSEEDNPLPPQVEVDESSGKARAKKTKFTEETAGNIAAIVYGIRAAASQEPLWNLNEEQKKLIGGPLARTVEDVIPAPIANKIAEYSAPLELAGNIIGIETAKRKTISIAHSRPSKPGVPGGPMPPRPAAPPSPSANGDAARVAAATTQTQTLADAINAAKGNLASEDEEPIEGTITLE